MALANKKIISFRNVTKEYPNGVLGLKDLNIDIDQGEFVIVVGLSGAGKSTMLRSINRLHEITSGEILIDNRSITKAKGKELRLIRRDIGMIFQSFNLVKRSSVLRNVLTGRVAYHPTLQMLLGLFPQADKELATKSESSRKSLFKSRSIVWWAATTGLDCTGIDSGTKNHFSG